MKTEGKRNADNSQKRSVHAGFRRFPIPWRASIHLVRERKILLFFNCILKSKIEELTEESEIYLDLRDAKFKLEEAILNNNIDDINKYTDEVNTQLTKLDSLRTQRAQVE